VLQPNFGTCALSWRRCVAVFCNVCCMLMQRVAAELRDMCAITKKVCYCVLQLCVLHVVAACCSRTSRHMRCHEDGVLLFFAVCVAGCCSMLQPNFETCAVMQKNI